MKLWSDLVREPLTQVLHINGRPCNQLLGMGSGNRGGIIVEARGKFQVGAAAASGTR